MFFVHATVEAKWFTMNSSQWNVRGDNSLWFCVSLSMQYFVHFFVIYSFWFHRESALLCQFATCNVRRWHLSRFQDWYWMYTFSQLVSRYKTEKEHEIQTLCISWCKDSNSSHADAKNVATVFWGVSQWTTCKQTDHPFVFASEPSEEVFRIDNRLCHQNSTFIWLLSSIQLNQKSIENWSVRPMWTIYALSEILILSIIWTVSSAETQVAVSDRNTCVLNGTAVYCWGDGMFVILF